MGLGLGGMTPLSSGRGLGEVTSCGRDPRVCLGPAAPRTAAIFVLVENRSRQSYYVCRPSGSGSPSTQIRVRLHADACTPLILWRPGIIQNGK